MTPRSCIEPLESRIAPASLLNARTLIYTDADGDLVTVKFGKDMFTGTPAVALAKANEVFKFDTGDVGTATNEPQQLRLIDFTKFSGSGSSANGVAMSVTAVPAGAGTGFVDVGAIKATGVSLGLIVIDGDLGQIDAGGASLKIGCAGLTVNSLGVRGIATQIPVPTPSDTNPAPDLNSTIVGELTSLKVLGDVQDARLSVVHGRNSNNQLTTLGKLGSLTIGGSLVGRTAVEVASENTGAIEVDGDIGAIKIGTDAGDGIFGGGAKNSGRINAGGKITSLTVIGSVVGGGAFNTGVVTSSSSIGPVSISGDLAGGAGENSGFIRAFGAIGTVKIGDDLSAGTGAGSGTILSQATLGAVTIAGDIDAITNAAGAGAGGITGLGGIASVTINGSILGGALAQTGFVESGRNLGAVKILGSVTGGAGDASGSVIAHGKIASFTLNGNLSGGGGLQSGSIQSGFDPAQKGAFGAAIVLGKIEGGGGSNSGAIIAGGALASLTLGSKTTTTADTLKGGAGEFSGSVSSHGAMGPVKITGNLRGGGGDFSGGIFSFDRIDDEAEFAGSLAAINISGQLLGGSGAHSATIRADAGLASLTVGSVEGGTGADSASLHTGLGQIKPGNAGPIKIVGTFSSASTGIPGADSATLEIGGNLSSLVFGGATTGATVHVGDALTALTFLGNASDVTVTARGQVVQGKTTDVAIGTITANHNVTNSSFLAGYDATGAGVNPDAQIGSVTVKGNWTASNLVAGAVVGPEPGFGDIFDLPAPGFDNAGIVSRIASVVIGGSITGTAAEVNATDSFGFVAQVVSKFKVGPTTKALSLFNGGEHLELDSVNHDSWIYEIPLNAAV